MVGRVDDSDSGSDASGRVVAAVAALGLQLLLAAALLFGLTGRAPPPVAAAIQVFEVVPLPPPRPPRSVPPAHARRPQGGAAPPSRRARAAAVVVPPPVVLPIEPPPIVAAVTPGLGSADHQGAAPTTGPATGAGGSGQGTGGGGSSTGTGDGDGTPSRLIGGRLRDSDYPPAAYRAGIGGTVHVRFVVGVAGRITDCRVTQSSGNAELDETTCRLMIQRLRYRPARDARGRKVPDVWTGEHVWQVFQDERDAARALPPDPHLP